MYVSHWDADDDGHGAMGLKVLKRSKNSDHKWSVYFLGQYPLIIIQDKGKYYSNQLNLEYVDTGSRTFLEIQ